MQCEQGDEAKSYLKPLLPEATAIDVRFVELKKKKKLN